MQHFRDVWEITDHRFRTAVVGSSRKDQVLGDDWQSTGSVSAPEQVKSPSGTSCVSLVLIWKNGFLRAPALQGSSLPIAGFLAGPLSGE